MHRTLRSLVALTALAAAPFTAVATAGIEYDLYIIEPWNQSYPLASSGIAGLNNHNVVVGCATTEPTGGPCSFMWTPETGKVPIEAAGPINDAGVIVATNTVWWPDGSSETLPIPFGSGADLNESNVIVGASGAVHTCSGGNREALVWDEVNGVLRLQQDVGIWAADQAWAINEHGEVVGVRSTTGECGDQEAFYLDLRTLEHVDIHEELVGGAMAITRVYDINDSGLVVGEGPSGGTVRPFLWTRTGGFTFLPEAEGSILMDTHFYALNNEGQVVGGAIVGQWNWHAIIWDEENGTRDLNDLVEVPEGFVIDRADDINDNGWIIGSGHTGSWSPERAVVLVPRTAPLEGDTNTDGAVDLADLLVVLSSWGPCAACPADLDGSGVVDLGDLLIVLSNWTS